MIFSTFSSIADQGVVPHGASRFLCCNADNRTLQAECLTGSPAIRRGFEFRSVCFAYPGSSRLVPSNLTFQLEPGTRIALVGENGEG